MEEIRRIAIERACERLIIAYTHLADSGEPERIVELFTPDGVCELPMARLCGHDELRAFFQSKERTRGITRHVCTNAMIDVVDERAANGRVYLTLYRARREDPDATGPVPIEAPVFIGEYQDRFVEYEGGFRFAHRRALAAFVRPTPAKAR